MSYLLDTCIVSYLRKEVPPQIRRWFAEKDSDLFFISVVTIAELEDGIGRLVDSKKKNELIDWYYGSFQLQFQGRILPIDEPTAKQWGLLNARLKMQGITLGTQDLYIASTAIVHNLAIITINTKDFLPTNAVIINPWANY